MKKFIIVSKRRSAMEKREGLSVFRLLLVILRNDRGVLSIAYQLYGEIQFWR